MRILYAFILLLHLQLISSEAPIITEDYTQQHPRLLFGPDFKTDLQTRAQNSPEIFKQIEQTAKRSGKYIPNAEQIRHGHKYWRADWMFASALAWFINDNENYRASCIAWMKAHCQVDIWGTGWRENVDIPANWYLYYIALSYDILEPSLNDVDKDIIIKGLTQHAEAIFQEWQHEKERMSYDQNHTYVPLISLTAAALVLYDVETRAQQWLALAVELMDKCRFVLAEDGYYYEGIGYWEYAFHWHVRYANLMTRASGKSYYDLPALRHIWRYPLYLSLPDAPYAFDIGDTGNGAGRRKQTPDFGRQSMLYGLAQVHHNSDAQSVANYLRKAESVIDDPAMFLYWYNPKIPSKDIHQFKTYHHFEDHGVMSWRSSWDKDASVYLFKCGPPNGYSFHRKQKTLPNWYPNSGHAHPDIGMFWMFAQGTYLATDTGYTQRKRTRDHNTILVNGQGMGADYNYWVYSGFPDKQIPYETWSQCRFKKLHMEESYAYALADFSSAYPSNLGTLQIHRHCIMSKDALIIFDDLKNDKPSTFSALIHADYAFTDAGNNCMLADCGDTQLAHYNLLPEHSQISNEAATVFAGTKPNQGADEQRGFQLHVQSQQQTLQQQFLHLLMPKSKDEAAASVRLLTCDDQTISIEITKKQKTQRITLDLQWQNSPTGPVTWDN